MTFVGVEFMNDAGIAVVRSSWLTPLKTEVYWPPKQSLKKFNKVLISDESVPDEGNWTLYPISRIFFETGNIT